MENTTATAVSTTTTTDLAKAYTEQWQKARISEQERAFIDENAEKNSIGKACAILAIHASKAPSVDILLSITKAGDEGMRASFERVLPTCSFRSIAAMAEGIDSPLIKVACKAMGAANTAKNIITQASVVLGCHVPTESETLGVLINAIADAIKSDYPMLSPKEIELAIKSYAKSAVNAQSYRGEEKKGGDYKAFSVEFLHIIMRDYTQARNKFLLSVPGLLDREEEKAKSEKITAVLAEMSPADIAYNNTLIAYRKLTDKGFVRGAIVDSAGYQAEPLDATCEVILRLLKEGVILISPSEKMELVNYTDELLYNDYAEIKNHLAAFDASADSARTNRAASVGGIFGTRLPSGFKSAVVNLWLSTPYAVELQQRNRNEGKPDPLYSTLFSIYMLKITFNYAACRAIIGRSDALDAAIENLHKKLNSHL